MKYYSFLILSLISFFAACQTKSHYDEDLTGHMPNSAEKEWTFSTEKTFSDENYFNANLRKPNLLMVDSIIIYTTKNQKIVALNANKYNKNQI